jgi:hypothetical protein
VGLISVVRASSVVSCCASVFFFRGLLFSLVRIFSGVLFHPWCSVAMLFFGYVVMFPYCGIILCNK